LRRFKLVRINNLRLGNSFVKRDYTGQQIQAMIDQGYERNSIKITLKFTSKIGLQLPEYFSRDTISTDGDFYIVQDHFSYEEGLVKYILSFGKECEVVDPPCLREQVKNYIEELGRLYFD
jgi:predicted DNA-binding transcriptional regulator YafY